MAGHKVQNKSTEMLILIVMPALLVYRTYKNAVCVLDFFQLPSSGQTVRARVSLTNTWFVSLWPYRIKP